MASRSLPPLSLTQHFEAPDDFVGTFGWLCGYSADAGFLNTALERFTGQTQGRRAASGTIHLAGILDPGLPQILPTEVPGFLHAPLLSSSNKPFRLMHAKAALLGFRCVSDRTVWQLRLIVATGNWTRQTLEESLDLAWTINLASTDLKPSSESDPLLRADVVAAREFFKFLRATFDVSALSATTPGHPENTTTRGFRELEEWCEAVKRPQGVAPRFFDNRDRSLLDQLPRQVRATGVKGDANYLALGSGYFEGNADASQPPSVLCKIVDSLKARDDTAAHARLLKPKAEIDVYVNPRACQGVAHCAKSMAALNWDVRAPGQPSYFGKEATRTLHAKFIFAAVRAKDDSRCDHGWLYLGSGNLTSPGFTCKASAQGGNLEAGVVFALPRQLLWADRRVDPRGVVTEMLPLHRNKILKPEEIESGDVMPERPEPFIAPPVSWCRWEPALPSGLLHCESHAAPAFEVLDMEGRPCAQTASGVFPWTDATRPRQVKLRWRDGDRVRTANVPVLDEFGRFSGTPLAELDMASAWWQLDSFPLAAEEDDDAEGNAPDGEDGRQRGKSGRSRAAHSPIRNLMTLVEQIADKQTQISATDWSSWCSRLEQTLTQAGRCADVRVFDTLGLNPLSPLWETPFRPAFAETAESVEGARYEKVLRDVEVAWGVDKAERMGTAR